MNRRTTGVPTPGHLLRLLRLAVSLATMLGAMTGGARADRLLIPGPGSTAPELTYGFGDVPVGQSANLTLVVQNTSDRAAHVQAVVPLTGDQSDFSWYGLADLGQASSIPAGQTANLYLEFYSNSQGQKSLLLDVKSDFQYGDSVVRLTANAVAARSWSICGSVYQLGPTTCFPGVCRTPICVSGTVLLQPLNGGRAQSSPSGCLGGWQSGCTEISYHFMNLPAGDYELSAQSSDNRTCSSGAPVVVHLPPSNGSSYVVQNVEVFDCGGSTSGSTTGNTSGGITTGGTSGGITTGGTSSGTTGGGTSGGTTSGGTSGGTTGGGTNPGPLISHTVATNPWGVPIPQGPALYPLGITGSGFGNSTGQAFFGSLPAQVMSWSDSTVQVTIPNAPFYPYTAAVSIVTANGQRATGPDFTILAPDQGSTATGGLPSGWDTTDIGDAQPGSATVNSDGTWTMKGSGADIWGQADAFRYAYTSMRGDFSVTCRVTSQTNTDPWAKVGVMIRDSLSPGSEHFMLVRTPGNGVDAQWRPLTGSASLDFGANSYSGRLPVWLRVQRSGSAFSALASEDGTHWTEIGGITVINMSDQVYAGVAITAHNANRICVGNVDHVSVNPGASPPGGTGVPVAAVPVSGR